MLRNVWVVVSGMVALTQGSDWAVLVYGTGLMALGLILIELRIERFWENSQNGSGSGPVS